MVRWPLVCNCGCGFFLGAGEGWIVNFYGFACRGKGAAGNESCRVCNPLRVIKVDDTSEGLCKQAYVIVSFSWRKISTHHRNLRSCCTCLNSRRSCDGGKRVEF